MLDTLVWLFGIDISDAFRQIHRNSEKRFTVAFVDNKFWVFNCLVFASGSAPTACGRFAAFLGRSAAAIVNERFHLQIPRRPSLLVLRNNQRSRNTVRDRSLMGHCLRLPASMAQSRRGKVYILDRRRNHSTPNQCGGSFPRDKCEELALTTSAAVDEKIIATRELRSFAGSLNFAAGVVHPLRPFLVPLWAALASRKPSERGPSHKTGRRDRLPGGLIEIQQCRRALIWIAAFLAKQRGTISRAANYTRQPTTMCRISVDASPWGIRGALYHHNQPISYLADNITQRNFRRFSATTGGPVFDALWEALAILVALRSWRSSNATAVIFQLRSDSLSALSSIFEGSSRIPKSRQHRRRNTSRRGRALQLSCNHGPHARHHRHPTRRLIQTFSSVAISHSASTPQRPMPPTASKRQVFLARTETRKKRSPTKTQEECPSPRETTSTARRRRSFDHCLDAVHQSTHFAEDIGLGAEGFRPLPDALLNHARRSRTWPLRDARKYQSSARRFRSLRDARAKPARL
jgi:hypothetical protein